MTGDSSFSTIRRTYEEGGGGVERRGKKARSDKVSGARGNVHLRKKKELLAPTSVPFKIKRARRSSSPTSTASPVLVDGTSHVQRTIFPASLKSPPPLYSRKLRFPPPKSCLMQSILNRELTGRHARIAGNDKIEDFNIPSPPLYS